MSNSSVRVTIDEITVDADDQPVATLVGDDGRSFVVPLAALPEGARGGDVLTLDLARDAGETERRRSRVRDLHRRLFGKR